MQSLVGALSAYSATACGTWFVGAIDITVVAVLVYRLLLLIRGTRAIRWAGPRADLRRYEWASYGC